MSISLNQPQLTARLRSPALAGIMGALSRQFALLTKKRRPILEAILRWVWTPASAVGLSALAALLCGLALQPQALMVAAALAVVLLVGLIWPWLSLRGLHGRISHQVDRVREGETLELEFEFRNRWPWSIWGVTVEASRMGLSQDVSLERLRGWRTTQVKWRQPAATRGEYPNLPPRIICGFPFGLCLATRALRMSRRLIVWPRVVEVGPVPEEAGMRTIEGGVPINQPGHCDDLVGVRPYRRGDSLRRVHWSQTTRHNQLIICELQTYAQAWIQLVVDVAPEVHGGDGANGSREWAIRIAASLAERWLADGARVELVAGERAVPPGWGGDQRRRILDELALIPAACPGLQEVLGAASRRFRGGLQVVISTDRGLSAFEDDPAGSVKRRWLVLCAAGFAGRETAAQIHRPALAVKPWVWVMCASEVAAKLRAADRRALNAS